MITVGSASAKRGQRGEGYLKVGELALGSEVLIPVLILHGREDPVVLAGSQEWARILPAARLRVGNVKRTGTVELPTVTLQRIVSPSRYSLQPKPAEHQCSSQCGQPRQTHGRDWSDLEEGSHMSFHALVQVGL